MVSPSRSNVCQSAAGLVKAASSPSDSSRKEAGNAVCRSPHRVHNRRRNARAKLSRRLAAKRCPGHDIAKTFINSRRSLTRWLELWSKRIGCSIQKKCKWRVDPQLWMLCDHVGAPSSCPLPAWCPIPTAASDAELGFFTGARRVYPLIFLL